MILIISRSRGCRRRRKKGWKKNRKWNVIYCDDCRKDGVGQKEEVAELVEYLYEW